jgi:diguanylate cyclase (GGDEF)-like protein/PAS domain S-box-containing protein
LNNIQITALESAANGVLITDENGVLIWVNQAVTKLTGYLPKELENKKTSIFRSHKHTEGFYHDLWETISGGKVWRGEVINKKKDGSLYHEDMTITPVLDEQGQITHYIAIKQDITAFQKAVENLRESDERFRLLVNSVNSQFYIIEFTPENGFRIRYLSENIERLTGYPLQIFLDDWGAWQSIVHPEDLQDWKKFMDKLSEGISNEHEFRINHKDGKTIWVNDNVQVTRENNGKLIVYATVTDITERKKTEDQIRHLATHDPLTNLPNRIMFREILEHAISYSKRNRQKLAVFFLDVNNFKAINDTYGHITGDKLLIAIADRLRNNLREYDTVSRISGDEFTLITQQLKKFDHAAVVAKKIHQMLQGDYQLQDDLINVNVSIGGSIFPEHGTDYETLIRKADEAMYQAKNSTGMHFKIYCSE